MFMEMMLCCPCLKVFNNITTCCDTFLHQWQQAVSAAPHESPVYFVTMLQAVNDLHEILTLAVRKSDGATV